MVFDICTYVSYVIESFQKLFVDTVSFLLIAHAYDTTLNGSKSRYVVWDGGVLERYLLFF